MGSISVLPEQDARRNISHAVILLSGGAVGKIVVCTRFGLIIW